MVCMLWNWLWKPITILLGHFILKNETTAFSLNVRKQIIRNAVLNSRRRDTSGQGLVLSGSLEWWCETVWCSSVDCLFYYSLYYLVCVLFTKLACLMFGYLFVTMMCMLDEVICVCREFFQFKILIPCLSVQSCALLGVSNVFIESVLCREYIDYRHQLVAPVHWSFVIQAQSLTAIQLALAIQTRVPDHLRYHFGFLLECRSMLRVISIWSGQGCLPVLWCISKTDYLKSGLHLKQMLGEMPSSNKFASMQQQKGKRYFCLFIQFTCFVL